MISGLRRIGGSRGPRTVSRGIAHHSQVLKLRSEQLGSDYNAYKTLAKERYSMVSYQ